MACTEVDRRRLCRQTTLIPGTSRQFYNARFLDVVYGGRTITLAGPVLGAPQSVLVLERLIALGSRFIAVLGWCGSLQPHVKVGDWILPTGARSEEGTSAHYPLASADFVPRSTLSAMLQDYCERDGHSFHAGPIWTTDAPLRETVTKVRSYGAEGFLAVEMEMSALFRVAAYRGVQLTGILVVSDELFTLKWRRGFNTSRFKSGCRQAARLLLSFCGTLRDDQIP